MFKKTSHSPPHWLWSASGGAVHAAGRAVMSTTTPSRLKARSARIDTAVQLGQSEHGSRHRGRSWQILSTAWRNIRCQSVGTLSDKEWRAGKFPRIGPRPMPHSMRFYADADLDELASTHRE